MEIQIAVPNARRFVAELATTTIRCNSGREEAQLKGATKYNLLEIKRNAKRHRAAALQDLAE
jgi:hypothetical protein